MHLHSRHLHCTHKREKFCFGGAKIFFNCFSNEWRDLFTHCYPQLAIKLPRLSNQEELPRLRRKFFKITSRTIEIPNPISNIPITNNFLKKSSHKRLCAIKFAKGPSIGWKTFAIYIKGNKRAEAGKICASSHHRRILAYTLIKTAETLNISHEASGENILRQTRS